MSETGAGELPVFTTESSVFEARRVGRNLSSDIVLYWSTTLNPYDFLKRCTALDYAPAILTHIEIVADDDLIVVDSDTDLRLRLRDRSLVRFNFADWSVTWMASDVLSGKAEIQAVFGRKPAAMLAMVKDSITGFSEKDVERFFQQLDQAA